jgi:NAD(P)-dependent dehydrogenase (short-subunit alcohol dehydrogenase family)
VNFSAVQRSGFDRNQVAAALPALRPRELIRTTPSRQPPLFGLQFRFVERYGAAMPDGPLQNQSLVIIGGTSGLGFSAARACIQAGAQVVIAGRNLEKVRAAEKDLGPSAAGLSGDAADPTLAENAIALAVERFGAFHGIYHVAGGSGRKAGDGPLDGISDEGWDYTLRQNLTGVFHSNRAAVRHFIKSRQGGVVLNMGSVLGFSPSPKHFATHAYATCKSAIIGLTQASASYYAPQNIRFNVIAPALVETPMSQRAAGNPEIQRFIKSKQPLDGGRIGTPADLDAAVIFLLSPASKFVTGQVLAVDGGWCVSEGQF